MSASRPWMPATSRRRGFSSISPCFGSSSPMPKASAATGLSGLLAANENAELPKQLRASHCERGPAGSHLRCENAINPPARGTPIQLFAFPLEAEPGGSGLTINLPSLLARKLIGTFVPTSLLACLFRKDPDHL